jgi:FkbM family methyltransferase
MNVDIEFNPNNITIWNYEPNDIELKGIYIDIETNLITHINTLYIPPSNGYVEFPLSNDYFKYCKGFKIELYHNKELVKTSTHIYNNKLDSRLYFHRSDLANNYGSWMSLVYEHEYGNKIRVSPNDIVYDLGANIGAFTKWATLFNPKSVYSFEPTPSLYSDLLKTFEHDSNVHIFDLAITDQNKPINFYSFTENTGNTASETPMETIIPEMFKGIIEVQGINLEEYVIENMLPLPTLLKIDIEGSEYDFIEHTSDAFFANTTQIILEFHHNTNGTEKLEKINQIIKRFLNLGYNIQMKEGDSIDNDMFTILITKFG